MVLSCSKEGQVTQGNTLIFSKLYFNPKPVLLSSLSLATISAKHQLELSCYHSGFDDLCYIVLLVLQSVFTLFFFSSVLFSFLFFLPILSSSGCVFFLCNPTLRAESSITCLMNVPSPTSLQFDTCFCLSACDNTCCFFGLQIVMFFKKRIFK